jgi:SAM-dependent methyltransferase|nr:class I SAM-dependent methyltransferase [uncultured Blautia sp.]
MKNKTLDYYNQNVTTFIADTISVDLKDTQNKFINALPGDKILDLGCGSGRDTKYFLEIGLKVTAVDGSEELCKRASDYLGIPVYHMLFQELDLEDEYNGIWACSSILHLPKDELRTVFYKMVTALKSSGVIYTSFKYGEFEGERNGRYFTDFTIELFSEFIKNIPDLKIEEQWITEDVRPGRRDEKWLNLLLRKMDTV